MYSAYYYTNNKDELYDELLYFSNKYCIKLNYINDLRQLIVKGLNDTKYVLIVNLDFVSMSHDLINYMLYCGGNPKLNGIIFTSKIDKDFFTDNERTFFIKYDEKFGANYIEKVFNLKDRFGSIDDDKDITVKLEALLEKASIKPKYIGYNFLKDAIFYCLEENGDVSGICNKVYPYIANKHNTTVNSVERNIRIALGSAWKIQNNSFGFVKKPSNKAFIASAVNNLKSTMKK